MAEMNTIYNREGEIVGIFRLGVAWAKEPTQRLGTYNESSIYDNCGKLLANFDGLRITSADGTQIGEVRGDQLFVNNDLVGKCIGKNMLARPPSLISSEDLIYCLTTILDSRLWLMDIPMVRFHENGSR